MKISQLLENTDQKIMFVDIFSKFLPLAMKVLNIKTLPKMIYKLDVGDNQQPTFGRFDHENNTLEVALANRHPNDVLRTVAHELVHYKQNLENRLNDRSGETGSGEENEANALAGVIMRYFNKQYPEFLKQKPLILGDLNERRKRRKRRWAAYGPGPYGWYGYNAGYSGDSGSDGGGDGGMEESLSTTDVHKMADKKGVKWDMDAEFMAKTRELTGKKHLDDLDQQDLQKVINWLKTLDEGDLIPLPKGTVKVDVSDVYDWYKLGMHISNLKGLGKHDFGKGPPQTVMAFGSEPIEHKYLKYLNQLGLKTHDIDENHSVGKSLSWSSLDEGLSVEDRILIFEEYWTKGNLIESNNDHTKKYFISLFNLSDPPKRNEKFIVAPLALVKDQVNMLDKPSRLTYLGKLNGQMIFTDGFRKIPYPSKAIRDLAIFNTFTFLTHDSYDKFRTILALKFNSNLPKLDENFADGKGPGRPGDSRRHGIPKKASLSQLDKIGKGGGRKAQLARWQANMRRGRAKKR